MRRDDEKLIQFPSGETETDLVGSVVRGHRAELARRRQLARKNHAKHAAELRKIIEHNSGKAEIRKVVGNSPAMIEALLPSSKALDHPIYLLEDTVTMLRKARPKLKRALGQRTPKSVKQKLRKELARTLKLVWDIVSAARGVLEQL